MAKRTELVRMRLTEEEKEQIQLKMKELGIQNMSAYLRKMALDGICVQVDLSDVRQMTYQIGRIGNNLNQIAKYANQTGKLYLSEVQNLQSQFEEIRKMEKEILKEMAALR